MRRLVLGACLALVACHSSSKRKSRAGVRCDPATIRVQCFLSQEPYACAWQRAMVADESEAEWRALFSQLAGKRIADDVLVPVDRTTMTFKQFAPYELTLPVDWEADPYASKTWVMELQALSWLRKSDVDTAAALLVDFVERGLLREPPLEWTWDDVGMAKRLDTVGEFFDRYAASRDVIDRRVVRAVARVVETHLYAMSTGLCYSEVDNHGMQVDGAILGNVRRVRLPDGDALWDEARARLLAHTERSVSSDGVHLEHSPDYQLFYLERVLGVIESINASGERPPRELEQRRDGLFTSMVHLLQPNLTFPQFGDTENGDRSVRIGLAIDHGRWQSVDESVLAPLEWVISRGARGTPPAELDHVYDVGGYAAFRDRWGADATTGHLKCGHHSKAHYHRDETTIEIYAHGMELIVDAGKYSYDYASPQWKYQVDVFAHNVLVVDDASYDPPDAHITAHGGDAAVAWVQATHDGYAKRGIRELVRTFAYVKPDRFVVIDRVDAKGAHGYAQHFHLSPALSDVRLLDERTVVATGPGAPVVVLAAAEPARASLEPASYFPGWGEDVAETDVVFRQDRDGGSLELPVVITVAPPGATPTTPGVGASTELVHKLVSAAGSR